MPHGINKYDSTREQNQLSKSSHLEQETTGTNPCWVVLPEVVSYHVGNAFRLRRSRGDHPNGDTITESMN